jgi:hypothetical protein
MRRLSGLISMFDQFWLRVHDDGWEEHYDSDPAPIRALRVVVINRFEETWTCDRVSPTRWRVSNPPPGKGWVATGGTGGSTLWRRKGLEA